MKPHMIQDRKNHGPPPPISFNIEPTIVKKPNKNENYLKVKIKTQPGDITT